MKKYENSEILREKDIRQKISFQFNARTSITREKIHIYFKFLKCDLLLNL